LLLFRLAPHVESYVGSDFSPAALEYVRANLTRLGERAATVELRPHGVAELSDYAPASFDVVVLNSVVQYLPSAEYLLRVLRQALELLRPGGTLVVGDVRNLRLLELFQTSVLVARTAPETTLPELRQRLTQQLLQENELAVDPAFFLALAGEQRLADVRLTLKHGDYDNELSHFRYDAFLRKGPAPACDAHVRRLDWAADELSPERVQALLAQGAAGEVLMLEGVPNARLHEFLQASQLLRGADDLRDLGELQQRLRALPPAPPAPGAWLALGERFACTVELDWRAADETGRFSVVLRPHGLGDAPLPLPPAPSADGADGSWARFTSDPLRGQLGRMLVPELRAHLQQRVPGYMLPAAFVFLDLLPRTPNGKIDRRALAVPAFSGQAGGAYVAPRHADEEQIAALWAAVLNVERVSVQDDFFELGGNSLHASQCLAALRQQHRIEMEIKALFEKPTLEAFAFEVLKQRLLQGRYEGDLEELVSQLSRQQVRELAQAVEF
jgi:SAM-dependent methyltransferase/aryl carrier-like protein